jgi:hypothetical protein
VEYTVKIPFHWQAHNLPLSGLVKDEMILAAKLEEATG